MKKFVPYENWEQEQVFIWARRNELNYPGLELLNGSLTGFRLQPKQRTEAKAQGMKKGYPDIFLPVVTHHHAGLFIELKRVKGGSVSREQREFIEKLNKQRYMAVVCKGHREAIETIKEYLKIS